MKQHKRMCLGLCGVLLALVFTTSLQARETKFDIRINHAALVLRDFRALPELGIPQQLLDNATGLAIVPNVFKLGAGLGGRFGRGIVVTRAKNSNWNAPTFITLSSASVGWQIGAQAQDLILVFTNNDALNKIRRAGITLGADAAITAGPLGRGSSAATGIRFDAPIYSYSRTRGLFAGIALDGLVLKPDYRAAAKYYKDPTVTIESARNIPPNKIPHSARRFLVLLNNADTNRPKNNANNEKNENNESGNEKSVRTFGIGESTNEQ